MPTLIKGGRVVSDDWTLREEIADGAITPHTIVPASYALAHTDEVFDSADEIGIWLPGDDEPGEIAALLPKVALVAIRFPTMNDGRGLSLAVLLRTRFGFKGELRAIGEVHEDVLNYMHRCGIDSYQLPDGHDPKIALAAMNSLTDFYQGSVVDPRPAFRRIARGRT